ncbi:MAG: phosphoribosylformylglycinamidine synthase I [Aggregatilineales bacterium]
MKPLAIVLHASGTNRDQEAAQALELAGARAEIVHLNALRRGERRLGDAQMLVLPGGFSYGDALGAGRLLALDLQTYFADALKEFIASGKAVIGICNGFQALVKADVLPGWEDAPRAASLVSNANGRFECRWVKLAPQPNSACAWTHDLHEPIECPVAHGEGRFVLRDPAYLERLRACGQIALTYADGTNPNGSTADIAGICNPAGNVLGLMPHAEDHVFSWQHPSHTRTNTPNGSGLVLFQMGITYLKDKGIC